MWHNRQERGAVCLECARSDECEVCGAAVTVATHKCVTCGELKARSEVASSMWANKSTQERSFVCDDCRAREAEATHKCDECGELKTRSEVASSMWANKSRQERSFVCDDCCARKAEDTHQCDLCGVLKTRSEFPASMWHHKADHQQRTLCHDCCRPQCTAPTCTTCKVCRQAHRKRKDCQDPIVALHKSALPTEMAQLQSWLCSICKPKMCSLWPQCRKERRSKGADATAQYTCRECQSL